MTQEKVLITGGAGFIGSNLVHRLLESGHRVVVYDNLSRSGCEANVSWLREHHFSDALSFVRADITDYPRLRDAMRGASRVYHLAGQVAVTSSVCSPRLDFEANALGTFNVLESARENGDDPVVIYASTNKVYGELDAVEVVEEESRYRFKHLSRGIPETQAVDFHSPYGCSKGAGDQYTRDYARIYGLRTVVVRQSCIYGYRQFGVEDQGWLAWFIIAALKRRSISIFGNGKQVRDVLFIDDLLDAYESIVSKIDTARGRIYNIGGGAGNTISIWREFSSLLEELLGHDLEVAYAAWRPGDQPIYISDIGKAERELDWRPRISVREGVTRLYHWIEENLDLFGHL